MTSAPISADARAHQRVASVLTSKAAQGRERQAAKLLSNPKLRASEIIGLLSEMPRAVDTAADALWGRARARNVG